MEALTTDDVLAAGERLDTCDAAVALRLAREATDSDAAALTLLDEAQARAERLVATPEFQAAVLRLGLALLRARELDGADVAAIINQEVVTPHG